MRIDLKTKKPLIANRTGGLSGPAVFPVAVRMVWDVYEAVKLPIIGCGGVSSAEGVCEMMLAGASAVEIGAANLRDPYACKKIVEDLPGVCERLGVERIADLTGRRPRLSGTLWNLQKGLFEYERKGTSSSPWTSPPVRRPSPSWTSSPPGRSPL